MTGGKPSTMQMGNMSNSKVPYASYLTAARSVGHQDAPLLYAKLLLHFIRG